MSPSSCEPSTVPEALQRAAEQYPNAPAILGLEIRALSYADLWREVLEIRKVLRAHGIGQHDRVAIIMPQGPESTTALLGVICAATAVPLNPDYSLEEFESTLDQFGVTAAIVMQGKATAIPGGTRRRRIRMIEISSSFESGTAKITQTATPSLPSGQCAEAEPGDIALLLQTSGTTAKPKIVPLKHSNVVESVNSIAATFKLAHSDRCLNIMPPHHVHGLVGATLASLCRAAAVACLPAFDPLRFFDWMEAFQPTWFTATPTHYHAILSQAGSHRHVIDRCRLRFIRSGSAPLSPKLKADLETAFKVPLIEGYGMTETVHMITCNPLPPGRRKPASVGPSVGPEVAIMDANGKQCPIGISGEVVVRGNVVMSGYESNPEANRSAFFGEWFRTGDIGHFDEDNYLFLEGKLKEIINRGGEKVAPQEVDAALLEYDAVVEAAAFGIPHPSLGEDVLAAIVLRPGATTSEEELRRFLGKKMNPSKIPSQFLFADEIPKGPTGKIQRFRLSQEFANRIPIAFEEPNLESERSLARLWVEVLNVDRAGRSDNFFVSGGDSLSAYRLVAAINMEFGCDFSIGDVFSHPTFAELAEHIESEVPNRIGRNRSGTQAKSCIGRRPGSRPTGRSRQWQ